MIRKSRHAARERKSQCDYLDDVETFDLVAFLPQQCHHCGSSMISTSIGASADAYWCHECLRLFHAPIEAI